MFHAIYTRIPDITLITSVKSRQQAKTVNSPSQDRQTDPSFAMGSSKLISTPLDDMLSVTVGQKSSLSRSKSGRGKWLEALEESHRVKYGIKQQGDRLNDGVN